jgi:UDP-N-acetylglucosamine transferase subunit ALG13
LATRIVLEAIDQEQDIIGAHAGTGGVSNTFSNGVKLLVQVSHCRWGFRS